MSPAVSGGLIRFYFDPIRSLSDAAAEAWASPDARKSILASIAAKAAMPPTSLLVANGARPLAQGRRMRRSPARETTRRPSPHQPELVHDGKRGKEPLHVGVIAGSPGAEAHGAPSA